jgi:HAD superfamily hydrolase (TIGR01458 family)
MRTLGLLLDLDGTLYGEDGVIPGALEAVARLEEAGLAVRYVTNTTRRPRSVVAGRMKTLGFEVGEEKVLTPARAAVGLMKNGSCLPLVAEELLEDLAGVTIDEEHPDYVLVGDLGEGFTYARLDAAFRCLMDGAGLIALQKNRYWQTETGLSLDAGPFVAALEYASGKDATVVGKPQAAFFESALKDMGSEAGGVAMVGDDPESDVVGAKRTGLLAVQVRTGKWRPGDDVGEADLILGSIADLPAALDL